MIVYVKTRRFYIQILSFENSPSPSKKVLFRLLSFDRIPTSVGVKMKRKLFQRLLLKLCVSNQLISIHVSYVILHSFLQIEKVSLVVSSVCVPHDDGVQHREHLP